MTTIAIRLIQGLGWGVTALFVVKNSDGVGEYMSELSRTTLHFLSRAPQRIEHGGGVAMDALSTKLDRIAAMRAGDTIIMRGGAGAGWFTTVVGGSACVAVIVHYTGLFDMSGFMYVTQSKFKNATDALKEGIQAVSASLEVAREELLTKMGLLELQLESTKDELKGEITSAAEILRFDLARMHDKVDGVGESMLGFEKKLGNIDGGVGDLRSNLDRANHGITLLCHVVAETFYNNGGGHESQKNSFRELQAFVKQPISTSIKSTDPLKQLKETPENPSKLMRLISGRSLASVFGSEIDTNDSTAVANADVGGGGPSFPPRGLLI